MHARCLRCSRDSGLSAIPRARDQGKPRSTRTRACDRLSLICTEWTMESGSPAQNSTLTTSTQAPPHQPGTRGPRRTATKLAWISQGGAAASHLLPRHRDYLAITSPLKLWLGRIMHICGLTTSLKRSSKGSDHCAAHQDRGQSEGLLNVWTVSGVRHCNRRVNSANRRQPPLVKRQVW
jgi:hypothetical protein